MASSQNSGRILVVDDEQHQCRIMKDIISSFGYEVTTLSNPIEAFAILANHDFDVIITDLKMPQMMGTELLSKIKQNYPFLDVVIVTAHGTIETAVEAMKKGADDFVQKPIEFEALEVVLKRVFKKRRLQQEVQKLHAENENLRRDIGLRYHISNTVGVSDSAIHLLQRIENFSQNRDAVLIKGEAGLGKIDIARMIHYNGPWASNALLVFDCAKVPTDFHLVHLAGESYSADPSAAKLASDGLIERAHRGTLVIANFHLLDRKCQSILTDAVVHRKLQKPGSSNGFECDVRIIATATPSDLAKFVKEQWAFHLELYDKLLENMIEVPPLRDRKEDIPILSLALVRRLGRQFGRAVEKIDPSLLSYLSSCDFPGNFQELESMMEMAVRHCHIGDTVSIQHLHPLKKTEVRG